MRRTALISTSLHLTCTTLTRAKPSDDSAVPAFGNTPSTLPARASPLPPGSPEQIPTPVRAKRRLQLSDIVTGPLRAPKRPKTLTPESKFEPPRGLTQRQIISDLEDMMVGKTLAAKIARTKEVPQDSLGLPLPKQLMMDDESSAEDAETVMVGNNRKSTDRAGSKDYTPLILAPERSPRKSSILAANYHPQLV